MKKVKSDYLKKLREESISHYAGIAPLNYGNITPDGQYVISDRYDFDWKFCQGEKKKLTSLSGDLHTYILDFQNKCKLEGREIYICLGTDSQNYLQFTRFCTCLCMVVIGNGVHILISRQDLPKIHDYRYRLLRETDISGEFARNNKKFFRENNFSLSIHADYNSQTNHKSNGVVAEAKNYLKHLGFSMEIKPEKSFAASYAADFWS